jgi:hypothetical protein
MTSVQLFSCFWAPNSTFTARQPFSSAGSSGQVPKPRSGAPQAQDLTAMRQAERQLSGLSLASPSRLGSIAVLPAFTSTDDAPRGSCFSSRSTRSRLMMGCEGRALQSLWRTGCSPKAACRTLCAVVPTSSPRDIARRRRTLGEPGLRLHGGGCHDLVAAPTELAVVRPYAVHDHRELARNRHRRATQSSAPGDRHTPGFQGRPSGNTSQQGVRRQEQRFPRQPVAALADRAIAVDLT